MIGTSPRRTRWGRLGLPLVLAMAVGCASGPKQSTAQYRGRTEEPAASPDPKQPRNAAAAPGPILGVTHVTRGRDLFASTDVHRLLQVVLDLPEPLYAHHALILDVDGRKLSKSKGATSLATLRRQGVTTADIRRQLGFQGSDI